MYVCFCSMRFKKFGVAAHLLLMVAVLCVCIASVYARIPEPTMSQLALSNARLSADPDEQTEQITKEIKKVFAPLEPSIPGVVEAMLQIADCESYGGRDGMLMHIGPDGELIENPDSSAAGVFQILLYTHRSDYEAMGLNPQSVMDNILFARKLVERRHSSGLNPYGAWECAPAA